MSEHLELLTAAIKAGKRKDAQAATQSALSEGIDPSAIMAALTAGMDDVGRRFRANELFVPEVLVAARAMQKSMDLLEPVLVASGMAASRTVVIGTVQGDLHDIGKNLVAMMLKGANYRIVDLGTNVSPDSFVEAAIREQAEFVALSALLTTTMPAMKATVALLKAKGVAAKVLVGGAPITQQFADEIGADGYSRDAASTVELVSQLIT